MKNISILGATGSIGRNTLDLISRDRDQFKVVGLTGANNIELLAESAINLMLMLLRQLMMVSLRLKEMLWASN